MALGTNAVRSTGTFRARHSGWELLQPVVQGESTASSRYAGRALGTLLRDQHELALTIVENAVDTGDARLLLVVAEAYAGYKPQLPYSPLDIRTLRGVTSSDQPEVRRWAPHIAHQVAQTDAGLAIELTISADFGDSQQVAHDYLMWIAGDRRTPFDSIGESNVKAILQKLLPLPRIDDHWVQEFIKKSLHHYPGLVVDFLVSRVAIAQERGDWSYNPVPWSSGLRGDWGLMKQQGAFQWVRRLFDWALVQEQSGESVLPWFGDLVRTLCTVNSSDFVEFLRQWISSAGREGFAVATSLARQTPQSFVFEQHEFVIWMMRLARSHGTDVLRKLVSALYCAAVSGSRSGVPGEPFPQDIKLRDRAAEVLSGLTRQDPAYELYSDLHRHAIQSIEMQEEEGRMMAEMDE